MNWDKVGEFLKDNAGNGAALVGALLTGGTHAAIASAISMVSNATGTNDPQKAMQALKGDPNLIIKLEQIRLTRATEVDSHIATMELAKLEDKQKSHEQTQLTTRNGDNQKGAIKWVRPSHATISLVAAIFYVFTGDNVDWAVLTALLALPTSYAGLRELGKHSFNKNVK
jgi:type III secretory pathway component EscV